MKWIGQHIYDLVSRFRADVYIEKGLRDKDGELGTSGQILSSTGTQTNWINASSGSVGTLQTVTNNGSTTTNSVMIGSSSSPTRPLHVVNTSSQTVAIFDGGNNSAGEIAFSSAGTSGGTYVTIGAVANDMSFSAGAAEKMRLTSTGRLGIGTTSPSSLLHLKGADPYIQLEGVGGSNQGIKFNNSKTFKLVDTSNNIYFSVLNDGSGADTVINSRSGGDILFQANASEKMRLTSDGKLGVGTTSPSSKMHVSNTTGFSIDSERGIQDGGRNGWAHYYGAGNAHILGRSLILESTLRITPSTPSATTTSWRFQNVSSVLHLAKEVGGSTVNSNVLVVKDTKIGIGTANPGDKLHVQDGYIRAAYSGGADFKLVPHSSNDGYGFYDVTNTNYDMWFDGGNIGVGTTTPSSKLHVNGTILCNNELQFTNSAMRIYRSSDDMRFRTNNTDKLTITSTGRLGIGTTSPQELLHLESTEPIIRFDDTNSGLHYLVGQVGDAFVFDTNNPTYGSYSFDANLNVQGSLQVGVDDTGYDVTFYGATTGEYLQWDASDNRLEFKDNVEALFGNSNDLRLYHSSLGSFIINNDGDIKIQQKADGKDIVLQTDNGTGGFTDYIRLDGSQTTINLYKNVLIGTTTDSGYKLDVNGKTRTQDELIVGNNSGSNATIHFRNENFGTKITSDGYHLDNYVRSVGNRFKIRHVNSNTRLDIYSLTDSDDTIYLTPVNSSSSNGKLGVRNANNSTKFIFDTNSGNLLIGTTTDSGNKLEVVGYVKASTGYKAGTYGLIYESSNELNVKNTAYYGINFHTNNAQRMKLTNAGNVLIGTTTTYYAGTLLGVGDTGDSQNGLQITTSTTGNGYILFGDGTGADAYRGEIRYAHSTDTIMIKAGGTNILNLTGTTATFSGNVNTSGSFVGENVIIEKVTAFNSNGIQLRNNAGAEKMRITDDGKVGIGTTSPSAKLEVEGNGAILDIDNDLSGTSYLRFLDNASSKFAFRHNIASSYLGIYDYNSSSDALIIKQGGNVLIGTTVDDGSSKLQVNGDVKFFGTTSGRDLVWKQGQDALILKDSTELRIGNSHDLKIYHDGSNSYIKQQNARTGSLYIDQDTDDADIVFRNDDGSGGRTAYITIDGSVTRTKFAKPTQHADDIYAYFGDSDDLRIFHSSGGNVANHTNDLRIQNWADGKDIRFECDNGTGGLTDYIRLDGSQTTVNIYQNTLIGTTTDDGSSKLQVDGDVRFLGATSGRDMLWDESANSLLLKDNVKLLFGNQPGGDLQIYHDQSNSYIDDAGVGSLNIRSNSIVAGKYTGEILFRGTADGAFEAFYDNSVKVSTTNTGIDVAGAIEMEKTLTMAHTADPSDPASGKSVIWSDTSGNLKIKINVAGTVVTRTIAAFEG